MDRRVIWAEAAWADLEQISNYIAKDSAHYAATLVREIRDAARSLAKFSRRGRVVPEIESPAVREMRVSSYRLIYSTAGADVAILGIIHGARDLKTLWARSQRPRG
jgi:toxin ParE1/3/4